LKLSKRVFNLDNVNVPVGENGCRFETNLEEVLKTLSERRYEMKMHPWLIPTRGFGKTHFCPVSTEGENAGPVKLFASC